MQRVEIKNRRGDKMKPVENYSKEYMAWTALYPRTNFLLVKPSRMHRNL